MITVTINRASFARQMAKNEEFVIKKTSQLVRAIATQMRDAAKNNAPEPNGKNFSTGRLKNSIRLYGATKNSLNMRVSTSVPYAKYVEYGTGIYMRGGGGRRTPWRYLNRHIWKVMYTRGQKPRYFMTNAFYRTLPKLENIARGVFRW